MLVVGDGQLLVEYPPTISVSTLVNQLKGVSIRMLRKDFPDLAARGAHLWTPSYFVASAGGAPIERLREYVEAQEKTS
ncbi:MAG TPA: IS200/IS605 family transposase [Synechococcales bacterium UBA10510]|nr:IS200/IS605 family transposase [Synechococcales bacterium UBA10510]